MLQDQIHNQISSSHNKSIESARLAGQAIMQNFQNFTDIHLELTKEVTTLSQEKMSELLSIQDPKEALPIAQEFALKSTGQQLSAYQGKMHQALCLGRRELQNVIDSAVDDAKSELSNIVNGVAEHAPKGSEAYVSTFKTAFDAMLQHFDQLHAVSNEVFSNFEACMDSFLIPHRDLMADEEKTPSKRRVKQIETTK